MLLRSQPGHNTEILVVHRGQARTVLERRLTRESILGARPVAAKIVGKCHGITLLHAPHPRHVTTSLLLRSPHQGA